MAYVFEKQYVDRFEVTTVGFNFLKYSVFERTRNDKTKCEFCGNRFESQDWTHLAMVKGKVNHLICDGCAEKSIKGGATRVNIKASAKE